MRFLLVLACALAGASALVVVLSAVVAFFLNLCNFVVTKRTSAVTLQVCFTRAKSIAPFFFCVLLLLS